MSRILLGVVCGLVFGAIDVGIMQGESRITRRQREMIATLVSATNQCSY